MTFDQQPSPSTPPRSEWTEPTSTPAPPTAPQPGVTVPVAPVAPAAPMVRQKARSSRLLDVALLLAGLLAVGGVAFGVGRATAPPAAAADAVGTFRNGGGFKPGGSFDPNGGPGRFALGGGLSIDGTVTKVTADSLTLKLASGQEITFTLDTSTTYHQATAASATDVAVGDSVSVKVKGGGRVFNSQGGNGAVGASPAPGASGAPDTTGGVQLPASDVTVAH
jgi:hypothetical protein